MTYVCCICMKSIDEKFKWEELVLPQNEDDEDSEIYSDDNVGPAVEFTNVVGLNRGNIAENAENLRNTNEGSTPKFDEPLSEFVDIASNHPNWSAVVSTPCGHLYHLGCIHSWMDHLEKRGWEPTCPYCRHVIYNSMELIPIYPVSFKEYESEDEIDLKTPKDIETKVSFSKVISNNEPPTDNRLKVIHLVKTPPKEEPYFNGTFWLSILLVTLSLLFYSGYVYSCLEILDTEDSEENEFDPLFGSTWTLLVLVSTLLALSTDLFNFYR